MFKTGACWSVVDTGDCLGLELYCSYARLDPGPSLLEEEATVSADCFLLLFLKIGDLVAGRNPLYVVSGYSCLM